MLLFVDMLSIYLIAPFFNNDYPLTYVCFDRGINSFLFLSFLPEGEKLENKMKKLETQYNSLQVLSTITKLGTKEVSSQLNQCLISNEIVFR